MNRSLIILILLLISSTHSVLASPGDLDPTFDGDGRVTTDFASTYDDAYDVTVQPDGKIIAAGSSNGDFAVVRYNPNGSLDVTFSGDGKVTTDFASSTDQALAVILQPDGKIIVAGYMETANAIDFALARYNPNGSLDSTFGGNGKVTTDFASNGDFANSIALQPDGKIIVAGETQSPLTSNDFALARFNPDGTLDNTFDGDGKVTTDFIGCCDIAFDVSLQADGKIVAVGQGGTSGSAIVRYNPNGSLDPTFDGDGKLNIDLYAYAIAVQMDGKLVAVGLTNGDFAIARFNSNGSLDLTFDGDGKAVTDFGSDDYALDVVIQPDSKITAVGASDNDFALARYNSDGSLDTSFGNGGLVVTDFASGSDAAFAVALESDGKIIAAGPTTPTAGQDDFALARYQGAVCSYCDDFNDGTLPGNWLFPKGMWNEIGGFITSTPQRKAIAIASPAFAGCDFCTVEASLRTAGAIGNRVWLLGWYQNKDNYVEVLMKEESDRWVLKQHSGGVVVRKAKGLQVIQPNVDYDVVISFDGNDFQVTVGGQLLITMPKFAGSSPTGTVGFQVKATTGSFDFVSVF